MAKERVVLPTSGDVISALRLRYPSDAYAFLEQVGDATGMNKSRSADAVVMSLWPSRGLEIIGIEVKVRRSDWVKELEDPAKAEAIARHCDRWYLAVGDENIVKPGELPAAWGLLVPSKNGMRQAQEAQPFEGRGDGISRKFVAAVLRQAQNQVSDAAKVEAVKRKAFEEGRTAGLQAAKVSFDSMQVMREQHIQRQHDFVQAFTEGTGLSMEQFRLGYHTNNNPKELGAKFRRMIDTENSTAGLHAQLERIRATAEDVVRRTNDGLNKLAEPTSEAS